MDSENIYKALTEAPGDAFLMRVLADALEDEGRTELALAYRWAADNGKWPAEDCGSGPGWWSEVATYEAATPSSSIPDRLWLAVTEICEGRPAGTVMDAFVRLSVGLANCPQPAGVAADG